MEKEELLKEMKLFKNVNLYYECDEVLKRNFDFITEVINIFKYDFYFIDEVAENYIKYIPEDNIEENSQFIELCILLGRYVPKEHPYYEFYTNRVNGIYSMFLLNVMMTKDNFPDVSELGFSILMEDYKDRKNILDYFALRLMNELYHTNYCGTFEDLIHKHCNSARAIEDEGYIDFFVRNLYGVDQSLSYYVFDHTYLLDDLVDELDEICENWEIYEELLSEKCVSVIKDWVNGKKSNNYYGDDFDYEQAMNEVIVSMNFCNLFKINRREIFNKKNNILSFQAINFKKDLKDLFQKVLFERLTITELDNILIGDGYDQEKVLGKRNE